MISHISIKDFAIIENVDINLYPGLCIITGETGAGKSIIIEALSMALGARADTSMVRTGCDQSVIQLVFDNMDTSLKDETIISREIGSSGKSLCKYNGKILSLTDLAKDTGSLVDIHGQYDHQSLLNKDNHIRIIDSYHSEFTNPVKIKVSSLYKDYSDAKASLDSLLKKETDSQRELDFLRYEISEIDAANPEIGEDDELTEKIRLLQNSEKIYNALSNARTLMKNDSHSVLDQISLILESLKNIRELSSDFESMAETIEESYYQLDDISEIIRDRVETTEYSKELLDDAIERMDILQRLKSKYGGSLASVLEFRSDAARKINEFTNMDEMVNNLKIKLSVIKEKLLTESKTLSALRKNAADELTKKVQDELKELNFSHASFEVDFKASDNTEANLGPNGIDELEFLLSANLGSPPLPLTKIASGGEMSRIMLALKSVIGNFDRIPTMIFDEIDSGISGVTASIVGEKLLKMSKEHQIICITHLPQIAAFADHHYVIKKSSDDSATYTTVDEIRDNDRINEIARLLGGKNITKKTFNNAEELIKMSRI